MYDSFDNIVVDATQATCSNTWAVPSLKFIFADGDVNYFDMVGDSRTNMCGLCESGSILSKPDWAVGNYDLYDRLKHQLLPQQHNRQPQRRR